ncbi:glycosyltransferase family 2 protein [Pedobacter gandavensis]|uniref:glycosyltransferase family 2 protein n=1 Tax=Pedobacter gandavensis TaxID=2679963 RepID=UPI002931D610|nr:glycosyltransferase family 2 protein [Pedobacter gandavensis]
MITSPKSVAISVVIPVFNGAGYLEQTLMSLLAQEFLDFEVVCVNDSSTDDSLSILEHFATIDSRIKVYTKPNGGNAAKAINYGLKFASGRYFMYSSQDDLYSKDLLEKSYNKACELNADAVIPNLVYYYVDLDLKNKTNEIISESQNILTGKEAFILSLDWKIHGFVLWSMQTVRNLGFFDYGLNSDEYTTRMLFFNSKKVVFSNGIFFYRQNNPNAITQKWSIKLLDYIDTNKKLVDFLNGNGFPKVEVLKVYKSILHDLIRIQLILNKNRKLLTRSVAIEAQQKIKEVFNAHRTEFNSIECNDQLSLFKLKLQSKSYISFKSYCKLIQVHQFLLKR